MSVSEDFVAQLAGLGQEDWFLAVDDLAEDHGSFEPLGKSHAAAFFDKGRKLLVSFESYPEIGAHSEGGEPRGFDFVRRNDWSLLSILAAKDSWFRDKVIYRYFDRLIDDGFFEDFDQVLFYGVGMGAYAATAFSVAAPGAHVLALRPVATQDPRIASWDRRWPEARRQAFFGRFGYAPDMIDAARKVWTVFDPRVDLDAMQAALFTRSHVTPLRVPFVGSQVDHSLQTMGILRPLILMAMDGTLSPTSFAKLYRARRNCLPYLRNLLAALEAEGQLWRAASVCRHVLSQRNRPYFARRLQAIEALISGDPHDH